MSIFWGAHTHLVKNEPRIASKYLAIHDCQIANAHLAMKKCQIQAIFLAKVSDISRLEKYSKNVLLACLIKVRH
jgi:hypothetical protein